MMVCLYHRKTTSYNHTLQTIPVSCTARENPPLGHVCTIEKTYHGTIVSYPTRLWALQCYYLSIVGRGMIWHGLAMSEYIVASALKNIPRLQQHCTLTSRPSKFLPDDGQ